MGMYCVMVENDGVLEAVRSMRTEYFPLWTNWLSLTIPAAVLPIHPAGKTPDRVLFSKPRIVATFWRVYVWEWPRQTSASKSRNRHRRIITACYPSPG